MKTWYLGKVGYQKEDDSGNLVTINEEHLIDAVSYTEAEARLFEIMEAKQQSDFVLIKLSKMKFQEVFVEEFKSDIWQKAKVVYLSFDEKSQKEKKTPYVMIVNADNIIDAWSILSKNLGNLEDYQITDINLTAIAEVHEYNSALKDNDLDVSEE
jgi:Domain of unknown function (DUF4494)